MKNSNLIPILIVILIALTLVQIGLALFPSKWEYEIVAPQDETIITELNSYGKRGWEVVSARRASSSSTYSRDVRYEIIMKRPRSEWFK